jgi:hypothetical protein
MQALLFERYWIVVRHSIESWELTVICPRFEKRDTRKLPATCHSAIDILGIDYLW